MAKRYWVLLLGSLVATLCAADAFAVSFLHFETAFGGKGSGAGGFSLDINLAFDADGNVYVSDAATRIVQKLGPDGAFTFQYPAEDAEAEDVVLVKPGDITVDRAGNIYVADTTIVEIPMAQDAANGPPIYIYTPCVHRFNSSGAFVDTFPVDAPTELPKAPAIPVRQIIDAQGRHALAIQPTGYDRAVRIDVDPQGNVFVVDAERKSQQIVHKFSPDGEKLTSFGRYGNGDGEFDSPKDIAVGSDGSVLIADTGNHRLLRFDNDGNFDVAFARRGLGSNEVTSPTYLTATQANEVLVKDDSRFVRRELQSVPLEILSLSAFSSGQRLFREQSGLNNPLYQAPTDTEILSRRLQRLEELNLLDENDGDEQEAIEDPALEQTVRMRNTLYHSVMHRVLRFGVDGEYRDSASYRLDQLDEELHDLVFVAADPLGNVYLQDESDFSLRRYSIVGFTVRFAEVDAVSSSRVMNQTNDFLEDYEDIDQVPDTTQDETVLNANQKLLFNYDLTPQFNILLENTASVAGRDGNQEYPEQVENGIAFEDRNVDNDLYFGVRKVMNPNPYRYREMTLFLERQDGTSRLDSDALFPELNRQASRQSGDSASTLVGLDWDLFRNTNLLVQYYDYNPSETSRNYIREFYDLEGNKYQVLRTQNQSKVFVGELNIKF